MRSSFSTMPASRCLPRPARWPPRASSSTSSASCSWPTSPRIGGGTLRDVILNIPVFWVGNHSYVLICAAWRWWSIFTAHLVESRYKLLLWLDAIGLAAFSVMGAAKGLAITGSPVVGIVMGMLTATFGGILRDLLAGDHRCCCRPEIYVTAAMVGGGGLHACRSWPTCRASSRR